MISTPVHTAIFDPLEWQVAPWRDKSPVMLLTGSAGGGKSRIAAEKINALCLKYPGSTGLMMRKAKDHFVANTLPFFKHVVLGKSLGSTVRHFPSYDRFEYTNGSMLVYGGMFNDQQREAIRGVGIDAGVDWVWIEEATRFTKEDFNELLARMRGKAAPWMQLMLTTNPDAPLHWINQDLIIGKGASIHFSQAKDNKHNPKAYQENLAKMTGILADRLVDGKWVVAEGVIVDNFDPRINVSKLAEYNPAWPVRWGVDDGYVYGDGPGSASYHPRVILFAQRTPQGITHIFDEYYITGENGEVTIENALDREYRAPEIACVDSSAAEFKGRLGKAGIIHTGSTHRVSEGIKLLRATMLDPAGVPLALIHPRCTELIKELQTWMYDLKSTRVDAGEPAPLRKDDHGPSAFRYLLWSSKSW